MRACFVLFCSVRRVHVEQSGFALRAERLKTIENERSKISSRWEEAAARVRELEIEVARIKQRR